MSKDSSTSSPESADSNSPAGKAVPADVQRAREDLRLSRKVTEIVSTMHLMSTHVRAYGVEHPRVARESKILFGQVQKTFNTMMDPTLDIDITPQGFEFHTIPLFGVGDRVRELSVHCRERGVAKFTIQRGAAEAEFVAFIAAICLPAPEGDPFQTLIDQLHTGLVNNIVVERVEGEIVSDKPSELAAGPDSGKAQKGRLIAEPRYLYLAVIEMLKEINGQLALGVEFATRDLFALCGDLADLVMERARHVLPYAMLRRVDRYEFAHPVNTCLLSMVAAAPILVERNDMRLLAQSVLLMDIGSVAGSSLTTAADAERVPALPAGHPILGATILDRMQTLSKLPMVMSFEHHLEDNFSGFPAQPYRWRLNFFTSLISIAERFDALTSGPSAVCPNQALKQLAEQIGTTVTSEAFGALYAILGAFPPGSLIELDSAEIAVVLRNRDPLRVRVITDSKKRLLDEGRTITATLGFSRPADARIRRSVDANSFPISVINYLG